MLLRDLSPYLPIIILHNFYASIFKRLKFDKKNKNGYKKTRFSKNPLKISIVAKYDNIGENPINGSSGHYFEDL